MLLHVCCRSLGQNFCTDDNILSDIVTAARVTPADAVIEVGPGTGNLTRHLLATSAQVIAVEKDDMLIERLKEQFQQVGLGVTVLEAVHAANTMHSSHEYSGHMCGLIPEMVVQAAMQLLGE